MSDLTILGIGIAGGFLLNLALVTVYYRYLVHRQRMQILPPAQEVIDPADVGVGDLLWDESADWIAGARDRSGFR